MILIICNSFENAQDSFARFMDFLETYEPLSILNVFEFSYCVETDDNLRYMFIDYRLKNLFHKFCDPDEVEMDEFFEGIEDFYFHR